MGGLSTQLLSDFSLNEARARLKIAAQKSASGIALTPSANKSQQHNAEINPLKIKDPAPLLYYCKH